MKKIISILLCLIIAALALTACANGDEPVKNTETAQLEAVIDAAYSSYDTGVVSAYKSLCSAVLNGEESVRFNVGFAEKVRRLFYTSFPLNTLVKSIDENEDKSGVTVSYNLSPEEHKKAVEAFTAKINTILDACKNSNKNVTALSLYRYVASAIQPADDNTITCYDTLMNGKGSSFSYAQLLTYLLSLSGVSACYIVASDAVGTPWGLVQAEINGKWFYLDPMTEFYDNNGEKLMYFGMTEKDIKKEGLSEPVYSDKSVPRDSSSLDFDALRYCASYELQGNELLVTTTEGNLVKIVL